MKTIGWVVVVTICITFVFVANLAMRDIRINRCEANGGEAVPGPWFDPIEVQCLKGVSP